MDINWLKTFVAAATLENFHQAAERLYIAQPTVTVHIKHLEKMVGTRLFERQGRNVVLTHAGKRFLPYAEKTISKFEEGLLEVERYRQGYQRKIILAVSPLIAVTILPNLIRIFLKKHRDIEFSIKVMESSEIGSEIAEGRADIGLSRMSLEHPYLKCIKLYDDQVIAVAPHDGGDNESTPPLELEQLVNDYIIFSHNHPVYWDELLMKLKQKFPRIRTMEVSQVHVTKRFIEEGLGISFLPKSTVTREIFEGRVLQILSDRIQLPIAATYLITKGSTEEIELFRTYLLNYYRN